MLTAGLILLGYVLGSCPWGYWLALAFRHEDIRKRGSGNIGVSNVWRTYGAWLGVPVLLLDVAKGFVPTLLATLLVSHLVGVAVAAAAMIGHVRPLFLRFAKGGKAIATGGGAFFALAPLVAATGVAVWAVCFFSLGFPSVASLATAVWVPIGAWWFGYPRSIVVLSICTAVGTFYLHRANVSRLLHGQETRSRVALLPRLRGART